VVKRWPVILTSIVNHVYNINITTLEQTVKGVPNAVADERTAQGKQIISAIGQLKTQVATNKDIEFVTLHLSVLRGAYRVLQRV
jgi:hypothetical protein